MWAFTESIIFAAEGVNIARGIKTWHTDMKWAKVMETWSRKTCWKQGWLTQTYNLVKKKNKEKKSSTSEIQ